MDTSPVSETEETRELVDVLAENIHALSVQERTDKGATDISKPNASDEGDTQIIPFSELSAFEKERYRKSANKTLKAIHQSGFEIEKAILSVSSPSAACEEVLVKLKNAGRMSVVELRSIWNFRVPEQWTGIPELYVQLGKRILKLGEPLLAYDVLSEGNVSCPDNVRLKQLLALALARSGATYRANKVVGELYERGHTDGETLGILARTHKDLWALSTDPAERKLQLSKAHQIYLKAYRLASETGNLAEGYYNGINAAATALLLNQDDHARRLAGEVAVICEKAMILSEGSDDAYWVMATHAEAALILGEWNQAEDWYSRAAELGKGRWVDLSSTRKQARIVLKHLQGDLKRFEPCFNIPCVVAFSGHMIDRGDRSKPRFPASMENSVRQEIDARLDAMNASFGYASAACGSDILFLEAMLDRGGEINVVLPFEKADFIRTSVNTSPRTDWVKRFDQVLERAAEVTVLGEESGSEHVSLYHYANLVLDGMARLRANHLDTEMLPLAVWDGRPGDGHGGTSSVVEYWQAQDERVEIIDLRAIGEKAGHSVEQSSIPDSTEKSAPSDYSKRIMAVFFADIVGYSKLKDRAIPLFIQHLFGAVAELLRTSPHAPVAKNTWGDAFFFIFANIEDAGKFALQIRDLLNDTDWSEKGLPANLNLRIALHAGPVYSITDPVLQQMNYFGLHVSRTARMEPITPPGRVYASQAFAALSVAQGITDFSCDYVGHVPLAKKYGAFPLYHLRRVGEAG